MSWLQLSPGNYHPKVEQLPDGRCQVTVYRVLSGPAEINNSLLPVPGSAFPYPPGELVTGTAGDSNFANLVFTGGGPENYYGIWRLALEFTQATTTPYLSKVSNPRDLPGCNKAVTVGGVAIQRLAQEQEFEWVVLGDGSAPAYQLIIDSILYGTASAGVAPIAASIPAGRAQMYLVAQSSQGLGINGTLAAPGTVPVYSIITRTYRELPDSLTRFDDIEHTFPGVLSNSTLSFGFLGRVPPETREVTATILEEYIDTMSTGSFVPVPLNAIFAIVRSANIVDTFTPDSTGVSQTISTDMPGYLANNYGIAAAGDYVYKGIPCSVYTSSAFSSPSFYPSTGGSGTGYPGKGGSLLPVRCRVELWAGLIYKRTTWSVFF